MTITKKITIHCSKEEADTVGAFIDFLENIDDDYYKDVTDILGNDIYDRVQDFYRLMEVN